jgi:two-component system, sensor histidine kinase
MSERHQRARETTNKAFIDRDALAGREHAVSEREEAMRLREELAAASEEALAAREEAATANDELVRLVAELREANERLVVAAMREQTAKELADRANRLKNEFLPMLAHELRNPLAPIVNAVALLHRIQTDDPQLAWIHDVIKRQVAQMARLLDDLLDLSRITTGKIFLQKRPVAVREFVGQAIETGQPQIDARGQHLTVELPASPLYIDGDPERLTQVFSNLINNASKFTPAGGAITIRAEPRAGTIALRVIDNGGGISADVLPHVFELFAQENRSLARSHGGLGIGLSIVRDLVEMHGGAVEARSAGLGRGSEFVVTLPLLPSRETESVAPTEAMPIAHGETHRVVIIEDNVDACEIMKELLETAGHEVSAAFEGHSGIRLVRDTHPEIVLCDIGLPELDGYAVIAELREQLKESMPFMIAISGYGRPEDRTRALAAGFDRYLVKPVAPDVLLQLVARERENR